MSDKINFNDVYSPDLKKKTDELIKQQQKLNAEFQKSKNFQIGKGSGEDIKKLNAEYKKLEKQLIKIKDLDKQAALISKEKIADEKIAFKEKELLQKKAIASDKQAATNQAQRFKEEQVLLKESIRLQKQAEKATQGQTKETAKLKFEKQQKNKEIKEEIKLEKALIDAENIQVKSINDLQRKTSALTRVRANLNLTTEKGKKKYQELTSQININNQALLKHDQLIKRNQRNVGNYTSALNGVKGMFMSMISPATLAMAAVYALGSALKSAITIFADYEVASDKFLAVSGATETQMISLEKVVRENAATSQFTATETMNLAVEYAKLGFTAKETEQALRGTMDVALASGEGVAETAKVMGGTLRAYNMAATETARVGDVMAVSFSKSALDLEKFGESMKYVAPIARAANISYEETTAALSVLADANISGSQAGTSMRRIMAEITEEGLTLNEALAKVSDGSMSLAEAEDLVGKNAMTSLLVLANQREKLGQLTDTYEDAAGEAQIMAGIMGDNLAGEAKIAMSRLEEMAITIGEKLAPVLRFLINLVMGLINNLFTLTSKILGPLYDSFASLAVAIKGVNDAFADTDEQLKKTGESAKETESAISLLGTAIGWVADQILNILLQPTMKLLEITTKITNAFKSEESILHQVITAITGSNEVQVESISLGNSLANSLYVNAKARIANIQAIISERTALGTLTEVERKALEVEAQTINSKLVELSATLELSEANQIRVFELIENSRATIESAKSADVMSLSVDGLTESEDNLSKSIIKVTDAMRAQQDKANEIAAIEKENFESTEERMKRLAEMNNQQKVAREEEIQQLTEHEQHLRDIYDNLGLEIELDSTDKFDKLLTEQQQELDIVQQLYDAKLIKREEYEAANAEIEEKFRLEKNEGLKEGYEKMADLASKGTSFVQSLMDIETAAVDKREADGVISKEKAEEEKKKIAKKYADTQFAMKAAEIVASTALAVIGALELGIPGIVLAALFSAIGIAQLAKANAERAKVKSLGDGGLVQKKGNKFAEIKGKKHNADGSGGENIFDHVNVESGELAGVLNVNATKKYGVPFSDIVNSMNSGLFNPEVGNLNVITNNDNSIYFNQLIEQGKEMIQISKNNKIRINNLEKNLYTGEETIYI